MSKKRKDDQVNEVQQRALSQFNNIYQACSAQREESLADRRFVMIAGAMWEGPLMEQFENRPRLENNKILMAVTRIYNEYRNNRMTVNFVSKIGEDADGLTDTCNQLYRSDEQDSSAEEAYDNAFDEGVAGGMGAFRYTTKEEDEYDDENDYQRICIEPIYDADTSVYFDLDAKKYDKSDARYCYVITSMTRDSFQNEYGDDPASWPKPTYLSYFDWFTPDVVYIAEYYEIEKKSTIQYTYTSPLGEVEKFTEEDFEYDPELKGRMDTISKDVESKKIKTKKVRKWILSGGGVLEDCGYIAGDNIPIVPFYGKRCFIDNIERFFGHVRPAKDLQRLNNMQLSRLAEIASLSPIRKPIFTPEQVAGHEVMWAEDTIKKYPYNLINSLVDAQGNPLLAGPVGYTEAPDIPQALAALLQITSNDIKEILGNQEMGEKVEANLSGEAIKLVQARLDMQTYIYVSNMAKSLKRGGQIWLGMARDVLVDQGRKMKGIGSQDEVKTIDIMKPNQTKDGVYYLENDIRMAKFDVTVDVGPSSISKRESMIRSLLAMLQFVQDPQAASVITSTIMMNMEGPGLSDVKKYFRENLIKSGVVEPNEQESQDLMQEMENQKPSPQDQYFEAEALKAQAVAEREKADTVLTMSKVKETEAKTEETIAKTMETLSSIDSEEQRRAEELRIGFSEDTEPTSIN